MQQKKNRRGREYLNDFRRDVNGSYLYQGSYRRYTGSMPYAKLRGLLKEYDYTQADIARKLGCSRYYLGDLMNDNRPWPLPYCYAILDMFRIDHSELTTYFPAGGYAA